MTTILRNLNILSRKVNIKWFLPQSCLCGHTPNCPETKKPTEGSCGAVGGGSGGVSRGGSGLKRAMTHGKCRMCFIPEEWFQFFHVKTGVSGFYLFMMNLGNYCVSKEILIMEHEYYVGLSWIVIFYLAVTKTGAKVGANLDKQVDALVDSWKKGRIDEMAHYEDVIKQAQDAQKRAEGQKFLMDAKKENIAMQLEAAYRERSMMVYRVIKGRLDYQVKRYYTEARVHQKWMIEWILSNVMKAITPEFERSALDTAIRDLDSIASKA